MPAERLPILSSLISGQQVDFEDITVKELQRLHIEDMRYAKAMGTNQTFGFQQDTCRKTWRDGRTFACFIRITRFTM